MGSNQVVLNVYDLIGQNAFTYWCGVGVFHTGVEIYGIEYAYGGRHYHVGASRHTALLMQAGAAAA